ncbi:MFS transporter [Loktanella sp. IMCC34160]|uniref:MFS transporter n=1 Tax=Loktanella sp. IMCC34160 TaxID=2510646 RepID=UPI00101D3FA9|nr:MFS transporter [Loktanella sp. IMCC34160]RYG93192.1 MFS transporter [Loktanella sp. IMCC34160]
MIQVFTGSWALFLGMFMLMIGNGLQGTLLGVRGEYEGFSTLSMSLIMSAYFGGFLLSSRMAPQMIRRVGHVRVFAALGSTISAVLILYPALTEPWAWIIGRAVIGFCFCGVYVTAESWLNNAATNENRGKALSLYMIVQMAGIVAAQYIVTLGDINGFILFIVPSVLVSLAFAPILLSIKPTPAFDTTKRMSLKDLIAASPLACVGMFLLGGVYAAQFGMSAVYGSRAGLTIGQISLMVSVIYVAALVLQYPIGWLSDRMDRRLLILGLAAVGGLGGAVAIFFDSYLIILFSAAVMGGTSNPLYALLIAYANDYLEHEDMAAASGGLLFINGVGAIAGPLIVGWAMDQVGPEGFWIYVAVLMCGLAIYAAWRMTRRPTVTAVSDMVSYAPISASATPVAAELAQEVYIETDLEDQATQNAGA